MSTQTVYKLYVESTKGEWMQVGPGQDYDPFPFYSDYSLELAKAHYERLGLKTRVEESQTASDGM